ncbi:MAG: hypothetical protein GX957_08435 [Clostridiaceae bacterium]|nr:hypothetical protein [Clostridiaceae bacterium]
MIIREKETKNRIKAKGVLVKVDNEGLLIADEKTGLEDLLGLDELKMFLNKLVTVSIADSEKEDINK